MIWHFLSFIFSFTLHGNLFDTVAYSNNHKLFVIKSKEEYLKLVKKKSENQLVEIIKHIPNINLDIRYATENNFTKVKLYKSPRAFAIKKCVDSLKAVQQELNKINLGIKIYDAYRPYSITVQLYKMCKNKKFVASPEKGSRHNKGCALDISLVDLKTNEELVMPTGFDAFVKEANAHAVLENKEAMKNRQILIDVMEKHGFKVNDLEWWHYELKNNKEFPIIDLDFSEL